MRASSHARFFCFFDDFGLPPSVDARFLDFFFGAMPKPALRLRALQRAGCSGVWCEKALWHEGRHTTCDSDFPTSQPRAQGRFILDGRRAGLCALGQHYAFCSLFSHAQLPATHGIPHKQSTPHVRPRAPARTHAARSTPGRGKEYE